MPVGQQPASTTLYGYLKDLAAWIANPSIPMYGEWNHPRPCLTCPGEGGVDLTAAPGTPVYALATGPLIASGYYCNGGPYNLTSPSCPGNTNDFGVVTQRVNVPGQGPQDLYYQHINIDPSIPINPDGSIAQGYVIQAGQQIGTVGGFGETEMGFNIPWGTIWGSNHPGPHLVDPRPWLAALATGSPPPINSEVPGAGSQSGTSNSNPVTSFFGNFFSNFSSLFGWLSNPIRILKMVVGIVLLGAALYLLVSPQGQVVGKQMLKFIPGV